MNEICYLAYHKKLNENAKPQPHKRFATSETIFIDTKDGMLFTARQVFDIIECLKNGETPDESNYTFNEITLYMSCRRILLNDKEVIENMRRGD